MILEPLIHITAEQLKPLQPPDWTDIFPHVYYYTQSPFCHPIQCKINGVLVGIGTCIDHKDTTWLAHIIVHPAYRNQGIGYALTHRLLERATAKFVTVYLIATPLGEPVYRKCQFETEAEYLFLKNGSYPRPLATSFREVQASSDFTGILTLDQEITGEDRINFLNRYLPTAKVYLENDCITGIYLPEARDGLILAVTPEAGLSLMQVRLQQTNMAILPSDNAVALTWLTNNGFSTFKTAKRMRWGRPRNWRAECFYNRISGQVG